VRIDTWAIVIYEHPNRFGNDQAQYLVNEWVRGCETVGIAVSNRNPQVFHCNAQLPVNGELIKVGGQVKNATGRLPDILVVVLPEAATDLYVAVKQYVRCVFMTFL
jgi:eukaryotic translation initiation factor 2C